LAKIEMRKYWFISEYYWPNNISTGNIITEIIDEFTKDNQASIISVGFNKIRERNKNTYTLRIKEGFRLNKNNFFQRGLRLLNFSVKLSIAVIKNIRRGDVIVTVTNPAFFLIFLAVFKRIRKFKYIIIAHDIFPENLVAGQYISCNSLLYKIIKCVFDYAYNKADIVIACGRDMQSTIKDKVTFKEKVHFIPNFAVTNMLYPIEKKDNRIVKKLKLENKFVVLFTGNIGRMQNIDNILETAEILKKNESIVFLFIGDGIYKDKVINYSKKNNNILYMDKMDRKDASIFLNAGDIGLSSLLPNMKGVGVPSKTYSYMATGKPILAVMDSDSEIAMMIKEEDNGWVVEPDNPEQLAMLIIQIKEEYKQVKEKGKKSYELSKTKYSIENLTKQFVKTIKSI